MGLGYVAVPPRPRTLIDALTVHPDAQQVLLLDGTGSTVQKLVKLHPGALRRWAEWCLARVAGVVEPKAMADPRQNLAACADSGILRQALITADWAAAAAADHRQGSASWTQVRDDERRAQEAEIERALG